MLADHKCDASCMNINERCPSTLQRAFNTNIKCPSEQQGKGSSDTCVVHDSNLHFKHWHIVSVKNLACASKMKAKLHTRLFKSLSWSTLASYKGGSCSPSPVGSANSFHVKCWLTVNVQQLRFCLEKHAPAVQPSSWTCMRQNIHRKNGSLIWRCLRKPDHRVWP